MKKNYIAPMSANVNLDPLMVSFGIEGASPMGPTEIKGTVTGGGGKPIPTLE